jgi:hypothetical protein
MTFETEIKERLSEEGIPELYIEFPREVIEQLKWEPDDTIEWELFPEFAVLTKKDR